MCCNCNDNDNDSNRVIVIVIVIVIINNNINIILLGHKFIILASCSSRSSSAFKLVSSGCDFFSLLF
jgi:hypothetical protein